MRCCENPGFVDDGSSTKREQYLVERFLTVVVIGEGHKPWSAVWDDLSPVNNR